MEYLRAESCWLNLEGFDQCVKEKGSNDAFFFSGVGISGNKSPPTCL